MFDAFTTFSHASGLVANLDKSNLYTAGITEEERSELQLIVQMLMGSFPFKYLGVPLTTRKLFYQECKPLIEKTVARKVLKEIQSICRNYLWSGKSEGRKAPVAWDNLCLKKSCGVWNLKDLVTWNKAAVAKHLWAITQKQDRLWIKWIHAYYIKQNILLTMPIPTRLS
ncbi:uncharacterized protein LOC125498839 [Beta vulgaris subsp. vulgaris]|uniref:uncharacterized protein LOC125498839 n=1 Tax=Beta vulgaris subsp. vulgaris TaxID=3555 RepID=UPI002036E9D0|nr:uncharacterized protein LOC125498839 [Beta vulgaris subsp. vulgaris]